jgi:hypothetical protein
MLPFPFRLTCSVTFPAETFNDGSQPMYAVNALGDGKRRGVTISASQTAAVTGPTPGTVRSSFNIS